MSMVTLICPIHDYSIPHPHGINFAEGVPSTGIALGAVALFVLAWSFRKHDAMVDPTTELRRAAALPPLVKSSPPAATPVAVLPVASAVAALPTSDPSASAAPPSPSIVAKPSPPATASARPAIARDAPATKPAPRKAKASRQPLPFSADELTF